MPRSENKLVGTIAQKSNQTGKDAPVPRILVGVASYGTAQDHYLRQLLEEFQTFSFPVTVVVMTNEEKPVLGAELLVGLPSPNPYSLPFAHRKLFADRLHDFDLFIYTEDDTLISESHVIAFLELQAKLQDDEILGFLRSETAPDGRRFISTINTLFRWLPDTLVTRHGDLFANFSNQHSGCFMATRAQIRTAIASGGFLRAPYSGKYGMLETAATDIYRNCGLRRMLCLSRVEECILPHLPNKYYRRLGIPAEELTEYKKALFHFDRMGGWNGSLFEPETDYVDFRWSKHLYGDPDLELLSKIPNSLKRILVVGATSGKNELWLKDKGFETTAIPLDAVFGHRLRTFGIPTVEGFFEDCILKLSKERFDAILLPDLLHLVSDPSKWLRSLQPLLRQNGRIAYSVPNTSDISVQLRDYCARRQAVTSAEKEQVHRVNPRRLKQWLQGLEFESVAIEAVKTSGVAHPIKRIGFALLPSHFASRFIVVGQVRGGQ